MSSILRERQFFPSRSYAALAAVVFCCMMSITRAEEGEQAPGFGPWAWSVAGGAVHQFDADLDDSEGNFSVSRYFAQLSFGYARDRSNSISLSVGLGELDYSFSEAASIDGRSPWKNVRDYRVSVPIRYAPTDRANIIIIPGVRSVVEQGGSLSDGRTEGVIAAAGWKFSETLTLGPGFGWFSELGGGRRLFPIILVDWNITERISLSTGRGLAASQGPGLSLDFQLTKDWKLGLTGRYEQTRFALDSDGAVGGAIGEDTGVPLLLTAEYSPWPMTSISVLAGVEFAGQLSLEDAGGKTIAKSNFDTAPVFGLVFSSRF